MFKSISSWLNKNNHASYVVFAVFAVSIFIKNCVFHYYTFNSLPISSIWNDPFHAALFYFSKLVPGLVLASLVFLFRKHWWTIVVSVLLDLWIIANVFYFRANNLFVDVNAIGMLGNLSGFESSLMALWTPAIPITIVITMVYTILLLVFCRKSSQTSWRCFVVWMAISLGIVAFDNYPVWKGWYADSQDEVAFDPLGYGGRWGHKFFYPYYQVYYKARLSFSSSDWTVNYVEHQSITSYVAAIFVYEAGIEKQDKLESLSDETFAEIQMIVGENQPQNEQMKNLVVFIVESLESWPLQDKELRKIVLPNISKWMDTNHTFFCDHIVSQAKHGVSADGQMLINTGMMPVQTGAACFLYGDNTYPNLAHFFKKSYTVNCSPGTWNQTQMTAAYGYSDLIEDTCGGHWNDEEVMTNGLKYALQSEEPFMMQMISVASHFPFTSVSQRIDLDPAMPEHMRNYLNCISYTDSCIGVFLDGYMQTERADRTIFVVTGDHTVFKSGMLHDFQPYAVVHGMSIADEQNYTPLVIVQREPFMASSCGDDAYQMDIFPTLLSLIGQDNFFWHGFGVNLLDSSCVRQFDQDHAYELSDQMIRYDYFSKR